MPRCSPTGRRSLVARSDIDDFLVWATLGVVLGGRIGYVLFYKPGYYLEHPIEALYLWHGGMSFHGGALGVTIAIVLFARARAIPIFAFADIICAAIPIGLFFGRIANFINGELLGRRDAMCRGRWCFPTAARCRAIRASSTRPPARASCCSCCCSSPSAAARGSGPGIVTGLFLAGYAVARMSGELFRQPDVQLGFLIFGTTMGQLLSIPVLIVGVDLIVWALAPAARRAAPDAMSDRRPRRADRPAHPRARGR